MNIPRNAPCIAVLALLLNNSPASSQFRPEMPPRISVGQDLKVQADDGVRFSGRVASFDPTSFVLKSPDETRTFLWSATDSVWVARHPARTGALIGGLVGMVPIVLICGQAVDECGLDEM